MVFVCYLLFVICDFAFAYPKYDINAELDVKTHIISAHQKVKFTNNYAPTDIIYFHIYPNKKISKKERNDLIKYSGYFKIDELFPAGFQEGKLDISKIYSKQSSLTYSMEKDGEVLKINLPQVLNTSETIDLEIDFKVKIPHVWGRFGFNEGITSLHRWYPLLCVYDSKGWHDYPFYLFHQPYYSDASLYKVKFTVDNKQIVISTGILDGQLQLSNKKTLIFNTPSPVRDFTLVVSDRFKLYEKEINNIKIKSYYLENDFYHARLAASCAADLIDNYSKKIGGYPYPEFSIAPVYLGSGGHETSCMILIDTRVYKLPKFLNRYFDFLIAHETGHQWWFNMVGSDEYKETWLDEALNSYFTLIYLEEKYGKYANVMVLPKSLVWLIPNFTFIDTSDFRYLYLAKRDQSRTVLGELSSFREPSMIFSLAYSKGEAVLRQFHDLIGSEQFYQIIKNYFEKYKFKNANVDDFVNIVNKVTDGDYNWYFDQWLRSEKKCDYAVYIGKDNVIVRNKRDAIEPLEIEVKYKDSTSKIFKTDGIDKITRFNADSINKIERAQINPDKYLMDLDLVNNKTPRCIETKFVPFYFPLYDYPIFQERDCYNWITGPDVIGSGIGIKTSIQKPYDYSIYLSSGYDFHEKGMKSRVGFKKEHVFNQDIDFGVEYNNTTDLPPNKDNDVRGGIVYLKKKFFPPSYGIFEQQNYINLYMLRDRKLDNVSNLHYRQKHEALAGFDLNFSTSAPYLDPEIGFKIKDLFEAAGHYWGGRDYFYRNLIEFDKYFRLSSRQKIAFRLKNGFGIPDDKDLFEAGSEFGLRGYGYKELKGSRMLIMSFEHRFNLIKDLGLYIADNLVHFDNLQIVTFFDIGKSWYSSFNDMRFKKDAGLGIRLYFDICGFIERVALRVDVAKAIDDKTEKGIHAWVGINQAF
ncbi:MAG: M1 family aminopeptidase [Candidatus Omnitrophota bacterium]